MLSLELRRTAMKALVCLSAVCLIVWCAVDIAIKLEERQTLVRQQKRLADIANGVHEIARSVPGTSGIESTLTEIDSSISDMKRSVCSMAAGRDDVLGCRLSGAMMIANCKRSKGSSACRLESFSLTGRTRARGSG
jgi:hypothetical protein